ncbi:unnamed protein product [Anisakis simplex]|uniref:Yippee domain-containing protein n=1 Tax=Anisakis simplex TaxID=6269 RepID=A0A0M3KEQ2_ANISI|nr:unnamed protein product [Anisakis simplex]
MMAVLGFGDVVNELTYRCTHCRQRLISAGYGRSNTLLNLVVPRIDCEAAGVSKGSTRAMFRAHVMLNRKIESNTHYTYNRRTRCVGVFKMVAPIADRLYHASGRGLNVGGADYCKILNSRYYYRKKVFV